MTAYGKTACLYKQALVPSKSVSLLQFVCRPCGVGEGKASHQQLRSSATCRPCSCAQLRHVPVHRCQHELHNGAMDIGYLLSNAMSTGPAQLPDEAFVCAAAPRGHPNQQCTAKPSLSSPSCSLVTCLPLHLAPAPPPSWYRVVYVSLTDEQTYGMGLETLTPELLGELAAAGGGRDRCAACRLPLRTGALAYLGSCRHSYHYECLRHLGDGGSGTAGVWTGPWPWT